MKLIGRIITLPIVIPEIIICYILDIPPKMTDYFLEKFGEDLW